MEIGFKKFFSVFRSSIKSVPEQENIVDNIMIIKNNNKLSSSILY